MAGDERRKRSPQETGGQEEITYHAADQFGSCALGCVVFSCFAVGAGMGLWYLLGVPSPWKLVVAVPALMSGIGLVVFLRSPKRGCWEVTFDPEARVVRLYARERGEVTTQEFGFDEIEGISLRPVERISSEGRAVTFQLPVLQLRGGRGLVRFPEKLSVRDPERAEQVLEEMKQLLGLD